MAGVIAMPNVIIDVFGDRQVDRQLLRMGARVQDPVPLWESIAEDLYQMEQKQFSSEGASGSGGWAPLAESTILQKARKGYPLQILRATDALMNSLTRRGAEGNILEITPEFLRWGTSISYGAFHQTGTKWMPQRRIVEFTEFERVSLVKKVQLFVVRGVVAPL